MKHKKLRVWDSKLPLKESTTYLKLDTLHTGEIALKAITTGGWDDDDEWYILKITKEGRVLRYEGLDDNMGFSTTDAGAIIDGGTQED
jgi:hypothetical protein